jgi:two-component system chemotaxis response regulator CheY
MAKILVIEDDAIMRMAIEHALRGAGHAVLLAINGKDGMNALRQNSPDLVVTDLFMPEQDGLETIAELRKLRPNLPVIAISGGNLISEEMLSVAKELGAQQVLQKPFGLHGVLAAEAKVLGGVLIGIRAPTIGK